MSAVAVENYWQDGELQRSPFEGRPTIQPDEIAATIKKDYAHLVAVASRYDTPVYISPDDLIQELAFGALRRVSNADNLERPDSRACARYLEVGINNRGRDAWRKPARTNETSLATAVDPATGFYVEPKDMAAPVGSNLEVTDSISYVAKCLVAKGMSAEIVDTFIQVAIYGRSAADYAETNGIAHKTVHTRVFRATKALRVAYAAHLARGGDKDSSVDLTFLAD